MARSFNVKTFVEVEINGETLKFYPLSVLAGQELKSLAKPIVSALTAVFTPSVRNERKKIEKESFTSDGRSKETTFEPVQPSAEVLITETSNRQKAFADGIDALCDPKNHMVIARLIADSLRDEYPRRPTDAELKKIIDGEGDGRGMDLPTLRAYLAALAEANREVFGPLGERVSTAMGALRSVETPTPAAS